MLRALNRKSKFAIDISTAWEFFSNPDNLRIITPDRLNFRIQSELPDEIYPGLLIEYKVSPLFKVPLTWVTEITEVQKPNYFIDEQKKGPYKLWRHEHFFKEVEGGVEVEDEVSYVMPFEPIGALVHKLIVKNQLAEIFNYRTEVLTKRFGSL